MASSHRLLINLSFVFGKPTGISNYAINLFPHLQPLKPTLLTAKAIEDFDCYPVPPDLTPERGTKGHLRRLIWTQFQLPRVYRNSKPLYCSLPFPKHLYIADVAI